MGKKKKGKLTYIMLLFSIAALCVTLLLCFTIGKGLKKDVYAMTDDGFIPTAVIQDRVVKDLKIDELGSIYNLQFQTGVHTKIGQLKDQYECSLKNPLFILNPYGTNVTGMYTYFTTKDAVTVEYTVSVKDPSIPDFTRKMYSNETGAPSKTHEGQIIGLIRGMENTLTIRLYDKGHHYVGENMYTFTIPDSDTVMYEKLKTKQYNTKSKLTDGLFVVFGYDRQNEKEPRHMLFYDNAGILRAEIPLEVKYGDVNLESVGGNLIYTCSDSAFASVDQAGYVTNVFPVKGYTVHHDFSYNEANNTIVMLASKTSDKAKMDRIVSLDLETGAVDEVIDMGQIIPDIKNKAVITEKSIDQQRLDWIHLNSIDIVNGQHIIVSSRELSSIIRIDNYSTTPRIGYIIADPALWKGTKYSHYVLDKQGSFVSQFGQHAVRYETDASLNAGEYYLTMFNNNYVRSYAYPNLSYSFAKGAGTDSKAAKYSYFYKYTINEEKGTYQLAKKWAVPYSSIVSYAQQVNENTVIFVGRKGIIGEYDKDGKVIQSFSIPAKSGYSYRVIKMSMKGTWFN